MSAKAMILALWLLISGSPALRIASVPVVGSNSRASYSSCGLRICCESRRIFNVCAAACMAATSGLLSGRPGFHNTVAVDTFGNASLSSARRLALRSSSIADTPVTFPPGLAKLVARPAATGSPVAAMTIGIVFVTLTAALASGVQAVTMTSTLESTSSRMMALAS